MVGDTYLSIPTLTLSFGTFRKLNTGYNQRENLVLIILNVKCLRFDEFGGIDVPAQLQYILQFIQQDKLSYVGHSQGTTSFWIAMETNPDLNEKIEIMFALGPVAHLSNIKSPIKYVAPYASKIKVLIYLTYLSH